MDVKVKEKFEKTGEVKNTYNCECTQVFILVYLYIN